MCNCCHPTWRPHTQTEDEDDGKGQEEEEAVANSSVVFMIVVLCRDDGSIDLMVGLSGVLPQVLSG